MEDFSAAQPPAKRILFQEAGVDTEKAPPAARIRRVFRTFDDESYELIETQEEVAQGSVSGSWTLVSSSHPSPLNVQKCFRLLK